MNILKKSGFFFPGQKVHFRNVRALLSTKSSLCQGESEGQSFNDHLSPSLGI